MQNLKPKKHLGQHFLADENIAEKIVGLLPEPDGLPVVEIGPGMGVLTKYLVRRYPEVLVIEFDPDAVAYLQEAFAGTGLKVVHADFLKWDFAELEGRSAHFVGNLPYNISSPIFFRLLERISHVADGAFMVQKEVADRICAAPGQDGKVVGILTVLMDVFFQRNKGFKVSPKVFRPPPKVMSAVFSITRKPDVQADFGHLRQITHAAFGKRRKTLRNSLRDLSFREEMVPEEWWTLRPEALSTAQFEQLGKAFLSEGPADQP